MGYLEGHNNSGFKVGDKIKIIRTAQTFECGWANSWEPRMNSVVNRVGIITHDSDIHGFVIHFDNNVSNYSYPYFVLSLASDCGSCGGCDKPVPSQSNSKCNDNCSCKHTCSHCKDYSFLSLICRKYKVGKKADETCSDFTCGCDGKCKQNA